MKPYVFYRLSLNIPYGKSQVKWVVKTVLLAALNVRLDY